jgi:hypothetical protein
MSSAQELLRRDFRDFSVSLVRIDHPEAGGDFRFRFSWHDGVRTEVSLHELVAVEELDRVRMGVSRADRMYIAGLSSHYDSYFIVDPRAGRELDHFIATQSAVSSDSRFIAYRRVIGGPDPEMSEVYLLYDLQLSAIQNRMSYQATGRLDPVDAGWAIYPPENVNAQSYVPQDRHPRSSHVPKSALFWLTDRALAFADFSESATTVQLITVGNDAHTTRVRQALLDPALILDRTKLQPGVQPAIYLDVEDIELRSLTPTPTLHVTLRSSPKLREWSVILQF